MKAFANVNARDARHAAAVLRETGDAGRQAALASGGSDLVGMIKENLVVPDVIVNLKSAAGLDGIVEEGGELRIGGLVTLDALSRHPVVTSRLTALAEAAGSVATPQIRNVGTIGGNLAQRPWCWYFRNGFKCFKNGGQTCYAVGGEDQFHSIFSAGPSYIVHPSDPAVALVAFDARFRLVGPAGERVVPSSEFFTLPEVNPARENVLAPDEVIAEVIVPLPAPGVRSTYHKEMDREAWTHAVVSAAVVIELEGTTCRRASVVLGGVAPVPWRSVRAERVLVGAVVDAERAAAAGDAAVIGAAPLNRNGYKIPVTRAIVRRTILSAAV
jgi:xanthine dehydrogenase YagS FAD-binding subunit